MDGVVTPPQPATHKKRPRATKKRRLWTAGIAAALVAALYGAAVMTYVGLSGNPPSVPTMAENLAYLQTAGIVADEPVPIDIVRIVNIRGDDHYYKSGPDSTGFLRLQVQPAGQADELVDIPLNRVRFIEDPQATQPTGTFDIFEDGTAETARVVTTTHSGSIWLLNADRSHRLEPLDMSRTDQLRGYRSSGIRYHLPRWTTKLVVTLTPERMAQLRAA
jgi:hypothetical protein